MSTVRVLLYYYSLHKHTFIPAVSCSYSSTFYSLAFRFLYKRRKELQRCLWLATLVHLSSSITLIPLPTVCAFLTWCVCIKTFFFFFNNQVNQRQQSLYCVCGSQTQKEIRIIREELEHQHWQICILQGSPKSWSCAATEEEIQEKSPVGSARGWCRRPRWEYHGLCAQKGTGRLKLVFTGCAVRSSQGADGAEEALQGLGWDLCSTPGTFLQLPLAGRDQ